MEINSHPVSVGPLRLASDRTEIISSFALPSSIHIKSDFSPTAHLRGIATDWSRILISSIDQPTIVVISMLNASTSTLRVAVFFWGEARAEEFLSADGKEKVSRIVANGVEGGSFLVGR